MVQPHRHHHPCHRRTSSCRCHHLQASSKNTHLTTRPKILSLSCPSMQKLTKMMSVLPRTALFAGLITIAAFIALSTLLLTTYERPTTLAQSSTSVPAAPTGLTATPGNERVYLSWNNPNDPSITHYEWQMTSAGLSFAWGSITGEGWEWTTIPSSNASTTHYATWPDGLFNGTAYRFRIRAVNANGNSPISNVVSATPLDSITNPIDTPAPSPSATPAPTDTPTATATNTHTPAPTSTPTATATNTHTPVPTDTPTPTATNTHTPVPTNTPSPTATHTPAPTSTPTATATSTHTPVPTSTPTPTATNTHTPVPTDTPTPTATNTHTPVPTDTPTATATNTPDPSNTPTATHTPAPEHAIPTATHTPAPTSTPSPTATHTPVPTNTPTQTPTNTPVPTDTNTHTNSH